MIFQVLNQFARRWWKRKKKKLDAVNEQDLIFHVAACRLRRTMTKIRRSFSPLPKISFHFFCTPIARKFVDVFVIKLTADSTLVSLLSF